MSCFISYFLLFRPAILLIMIKILEISFSFCLKWDLWVLDFMFCLSYLFMFGGTWFQRIFWGFKVSVTWYYIWLIALQAAEILFENIFYLEWLIHFSVSFWIPLIHWDLCYLFFFFSVTSIFSFVLLFNTISSHILWTSTCGSKYFSFPASWITALPWQSGLHNSTKLWAVPDRSQWRALTAHGPQEEGMARHSSILAPRPPRAV